MSVSALSSIFNQQQLSAITNPYQQQLQQLGKALQSGNLSAAQSDFATLQQAFSQPASTIATTTGAASTTTSNPANQSFNQLASDLQSGNLAAAQKDFSTVQQDIKGYGSPPINYFQGHGRISTGGGSGSPTTQNSLAQDLSQTGQNLISNSPARAQQAYANLQQQFQQFALGNEDASELSNLPVSLVA